MSAAGSRTWNSTSSAINQYVRLSRDAALQRSRQRASSTHRSRRRRTGCGRPWPPVAHAARCARAPDRRRVAACAIRTRAGLPARRGTRREVRARGRRPGNAVQAEDAPVIARRIPGHQVPALAGVRHALRFHHARAGLAAPIPIIKRHPQLIAAGRRQRGQQRRVHRGAMRLQRHDGGAQRVGAPAQARRHDLFQLDQRAQRGFLDAAHRAGGRRAQRDGNRQRFLVVQQQRRQGLAGTQGIAAGDAAAGVDGVAQLAQLVDIPPQRARMHLQRRGQLRAAPVAAGLQQRQQAQQAVGGGEHGARGE